MTIEIYLKNPVKFDDPIIKILRQSAHDQGLDCGCDLSSQPPWCMCWTRTTWEFVEYFYIEISKYCDMKLTEMLIFALNSSPQVLAYKDWEQDIESKDFQYWDKFKPTSIKQKLICM